jgi:hypothetical protein
VDDASSVFDASVLTGPVANFPVADSFDRSRERDYSTGDIPRVFLTSAVWDVPWGRGRGRQLPALPRAVFNDWTLTGVLTLQSGMPFAVTQTTNNNAFAGFGTQRPNRVGNPELPADERSPGRWFDTNAFQTAPQFAIGTSVAQPGARPGLSQSRPRNHAAHTAASKALEVHTEIFNLTNTTHFNAPNGVLGSAACGTISSAGDPRVVQLALKLVS